MCGLVWGTGLDVSIPPLCGLLPSAHRSPAGDGGSAWDAHFQVTPTESARAGLKAPVQLGQRDGARAGDFLQVKFLQDLPGLRRSRDKERIWLGNRRCPGKRGCTGREWVGERG